MTPRQGSSDNVPATFTRPMGKKNPASFHWRDSTGAPFGPEAPGLPNEESGKSWRAHYQLRLSEYVPLVPE